MHSGSTVIAIAQTDLLAKSVVNLDFVTQHIAAAINTFILDPKGITS